MTDARRARRLPAWGVPALLAAFLAGQYGYALRVPFINDDFVFLDLTRALPFGGIWAPHTGWVGRYYRPWSRELHYWILQRLFGAREAPFHLASFALWVGALTLFFLLARRLAGARVAALAAAGAAALAAWGMPVVWAAGVQDLWMILWALACLLLLAHGRTALATVAGALALLSKETAALLPLLALAFPLVVERRPWREALRRTGPLLAVGVAWAALHPQLGGRLWSAAQEAPARLAPAPMTVLARTLLATVNLDAVPRPEFGWGAPLALGALGAACLVALAAWGLAARGGREERGAPAAGTPGVAWFAAAWAAAGWLPLLAPSVGWHAYYGLLGMLGAWLLLGLALARRPRVALAAIAALALLRPVEAATVSRDWGDEWYQRRAAEFLDGMRRDLLVAAPAPAPRTRFFFVDVPSEIGFLQGDGPALRVWYGDPTLRGALFAGYRPRPATDPGPDRFFRWDSTAGWIELRRGPEPARETARPGWRVAHERLAIALSRGGDWAGAAAEYAKLADACPDSVSYAYYAGLAALAAGDSVAARARLARAAALPGADEEVRAAARGFGAAMPVERAAAARSRAGR